ncbi:MAG: adenylate/guanylate cyclase domain-containing protein [Verrucomicrobiota bacterium]
MNATDTTHEPAPATAPDQHGFILVVDDNEMNRDVLSRRLERQGHTFMLADSGAQALEMMRQKDFDLVLLDVMMPGMDGDQVLRQMKDDERLRHVPVVMMSALDELDSVVRCIELGAEDYLPKPFNPVLLRARIGACLEKKRLRDKEQDFLKQLQAEQEKSERLLLNILPKAIADRLKQGETRIADSFPAVTVLFADLAGFTELSGRVSADQIVDSLNSIFSAFDVLAEKHGLEKIKTIGDAYMVVSGLPQPRADHAEAMAGMALDMLAEVKRLNAANGTSFSMRIGIHSGPVVAGIIGKNKFIYDLWGDTVNIASRMESHSLPNQIQVTEATSRLLDDKFQLEPRGAIEVKGKGEMRTFFLKGRK